MQPHAGVQVMVVGLAGHVSHGEVYCCTVGDGRCRGHRQKPKRDTVNAAVAAKRELRVSRVVRLSAVFLQPCIQRRTINYTTA